MGLSLSKLHSVVLCCVMSGCFVIVLQGRIQSFWLQWPCPVNAFKNIKRLISASHAWETVMVPGPRITHFYCTGWNINTQNRAQTEHSSVITKNTRSGCGLKWQQHRLHEESKWILTCKVKSSRWFVFTTETHCMLNDWKVCFPDIYISLITHKQKQNTEFEGHFLRIQLGTSNTTFLFFCVSE